MRIPTYRIRHPKTEATFVVNQDEYQRECVDGKWRGYDIIAESNPAILAVRHVPSPIKPELLAEDERGEMLYQGAPPPEATAQQFADLTPRITNESTEERLSRLMNELQQVQEEIAEGQKKRETREEATGDAQESSEQSDESSETPSIDVDSLSVEGVKAAVRDSNPSTDELSQMLAHESSEQGLKRGTLIKWLETKVAKAA